MKFSPDEVIFSPTEACNLHCSHCAVTGTGRQLSPAIAARFLVDCAAHGIKRVGFTGGEPFLAPAFLRDIVRRARQENMLFGLIMTNGVWYRDKKHLNRSLSALREAGYDGGIGLSVDAFHRQDMRKLAFFIKATAAVWNRPDMVSLVFVSGAKDEETAAKLKRLGRELGLETGRFSGGRAVFAGGDFFIKTTRIDVSAAGRAAGLRDPWGEKWFKDDFCRGPGNILFVSGGGKVAPCCGYANELGALRIGDIARDGAGAILRNARNNRFVSTVFSSGLGAIRRRLEKSGVKFPGKAGNHCFFCYYILTGIPRPVLEKCLDK